MKLTSIEVKTSRAIYYSSTCLHFILFNYVHFSGLYQLSVQRAYLNNLTEAWHGLNTWRKDSGVIRIETKFSRKLLMKTCTSNWHPLIAFWRRIHVPYKPIPSLHALSATQKQMFALKTILPAAGTNSSQAGPVSHRAIRRATSTRPSYNISVGLPALWKIGIQSQSARQFPSTRNIDVLLGPIRLWCVL